MRGLTDTGRSSDSPARQHARDSRRLLDRIFDTPHLPQAIPRLRPELLHRVIQSCGLEDCGELVALATPEQLARIFDLDLWQAAQPGSDERFDTGRFGVWLEVLVESGASRAAQALATMDVELAVAGLADHVRVFDVASVNPYETTDGERMTPLHIPDGVLACTVSGYVLTARRTESWDAIVAVLIALDAEHPDCFHQVMRGCRALSSSAPERDGFHDLPGHRDRALLDLASDREERREEQGYATPAQARAFLEMSRQLRRASDAMPPANPVAHAYFRTIRQTTTAKPDGGARLPGRPDDVGARDDAAQAVLAVVDVLSGAGIVEAPPRALLDGPHDRAQRPASIRAHLQFVLECDRAAFSTRSSELAFLANALMAGCSLQARPFGVQEASDAALAVCNLGLENWPARWIRELRPSGLDSRTALPDDFLVGHDLVSVFQVGWTVLHEDVCMYAAEQLSAVLARVRCDDREIRAGLDALRVEITRHRQAGAPWRARGALDVIALLDMPAWAALLGLLDECPVLHAGAAAACNPRVHAVPASAFEFISANSQIASVREFLQSLPDLLRGAGVWSAD